MTSSEFNSGSVYNVPRRFFPPDNSIFLELLISIGKNLYDYNFQVKETKNQEGSVNEEEKDSHDSIVRE